MSGARFILLVSDERDVVEPLVRYLEGSGYLARASPAGPAIDALLAATDVAALVVDRDLPNEGGRALVERLRPGFAGPILVMSALDDRIERVLLLELGADDFLVKPVAPRELAARLAAQLDRYRRPEARFIRFETATADLPTARLMHDDGRVERLAPGEIALIRTLTARPGDVVSRDELLSGAPASDGETFDRAIDSRVARLRAKLGTQSIATLRGVGYRFDPPQLRRKPS